MPRLLVDPPRPPLLLRPLLYLVSKVAGGDPIPARILTWFPKGAVAAGIFEALAPDASDLDPRILAIARVAASVAVGCPFCSDMNVAAARRRGLSPDEIASLDAGHEGIASFSPREAIALRYARALSSTPVVLSDDLAQALVDGFAPRERVVLAIAIAQVNFWARFNHGLGVPSAGYDRGTCPAR